MSTGLEYLSAFVERALATPTNAEGIGEPVEPDYLKASSRHLQVIDTPPSVERRETYTVEEARNIVRNAILDYTELVEPEHMLLVKMAPGTGKSHIAAGIAGYLSVRQRRVLWAAPRHDYIRDLRTLSAKQGYNPDNVYEWQPRQAGDEATGKVETCLHTEAIGKWMNKGYQGIDFCSRVCGWDYIKRSCAYHAQQERPEPVVMGVHQHVTLGHPLDFQVVIGDESPLSTFINQWVIPARFVMPPNMDHAQALTEVIHKLRSLCDGGQHAAGETLLHMLGGAQNVFDACKDFFVPADAKALVPFVRTTEDAVNAPYFHLPALVPLLTREAEASLAGKKYPERIIVHGGHLMLMLRREVNDTMPKHLIWLDATGDEHLYEALFRRPVQVIDPQVEMRGKLVQVTGRSNNKLSLLRKDEDETEEINGPRFDQLLAQIRHIIDANHLQKPGVITYKKVAAELEKQRIPNLRLMHFYAARGANSMEDVDGLIVAGTPQPNTHAVENLARIVFFERMDAFDRNFNPRLLPFNWTAPDGTGRAYPIAGFWQDEQLEAMLWQQRDAEIIQSVHRARIVNRDVTVWLLSNLPIDELPPSELIDLRELLGAPDETDVFLWAQALRIAEQLSNEQGFVTTADLKAKLGIDRRTAWKYIERLAAMDGWDLGAQRTGKVGKPAKTAFRAMTTRQ